MKRDWLFVASRGLAPAGIKKIKLRIATAKRVARWRKMKRKVKYEG